MSVISKIITHKGTQQDHQYALEVIHKGTQFSTQTQRHKAQNGFSCRFYLSRPPTYKVRSNSFHDTISLRTLQPQKLKECRLTNGRDFNQMNFVTGGGEQKGIPIF